MANTSQEQTKQSPLKQQVQQQLQQQSQSRQQAQSQPMSGSVRELAYRLWEEAGCPEGQPERFWLEAEDRINRNKANRT